MNTKKVESRFLKVYLVPWLIVCFASFLFAKSELDIQYFAKSEILSLEKAPISDLPTAEKRLFFGQLDEANSLMDLEYQNMLLNSGGKGVILISETPIEASQVRSVSRKVHENVIRQLEDQREKSPVKNGNKILF